MAVRLAGAMLALVVLGARADASPSCPGDCDADGAVGIAELIAAAVACGAGQLRIATGPADHASAIRACDLRGDRGGPQWNRHRRAAGHRVLGVAAGTPSL
jgi:hypothetical protein